MAVTRDDVARAAGVSPAVVSYVVNNGPRPVSVKTREHVLEVIRRLGYKPDGIARSLRTRRSGALGLVIPDASNPFFAELARAIEDSAYEAGMSVLVCNSADDVQRESRYVRRLAERRVDGLILISARAEQDLTDLLDLGIPIVAMDRSPDDSPISTIRVRNREAAECATEHLLGHGHSNVAFVSGPALGVSEARRTGWEEAHRRHGRSPGPSVARPFSYEGGATAMQELLADSRSRPTAVLVSSDIQAIGLLHQATRLRLSVPGDLAVISFDGTDAARYSVPSLSTVAQPIKRMASEVTSILTNGTDADVHLVLDAPLLLSESCGHRPLPLQENDHQ
jgi:LacI family transcriptional regulator